MSIGFRSALFKLCKKLFDDPRVNEIRKLIINLNTSIQNKDGTFVPQKNHGDFGYVASNQRIQFLGYLFIDEEVEKVNMQKPFHVTHLDEKERATIECAHETIQYFINMCLDDIKHKYPKAAMLIDPYSQYKKPSNKTDSASFLAENELHECVTAFKEGKIYKKIINNGVLFMLEDVDAGALQYVTSCLKKQFLDELDFISKDTYDFLKRADSPKEPQAADILMMYCIYCYSLRESLQIASQMIFNAIIGAKMTVMDNNNIIDMKGAHNDAVYEKYITVIDKLVMGTQYGVGNIVLLNCELANERKIKEFGVIIGLTTNFASEFGTSSKITMITVDEELNKIHNLTETMMNTVLGKAPVVCRINNIII